MVIRKINLLNFMVQALPGRFIHGFFITTLVCLRWFLIFPIGNQPLGESIGAYCGIYIYSSGWWFGTMEFDDFPFSWEFHHPN